jgi:hypothetical protein
MSKTELKRMVVLAEIPIILLTRLERACEIIPSHGVFMLNEDLPHDADGDALRRLLADGSDLSKAMEIDFAMDIQNQKMGQALAEVASRIGFCTRVKQDEVTGRWTCYCTRTLIPTYDEIIGIQNLLEVVGRPFNAKPDGWGSFGNAVE